jgi:hypothetical protein
MEPESRRSKSKYQRQKIKVHKRRRNRRLGRRIAFGLMLVFAVLAAGGGGIWAVVHFAKPQVEDPAAGGPVEPPEPRLIGMWLSDGDSTIAELRTNKIIASNDEELNLRKRFYNTVVTYTANTMTTNTRGRVDSQRYDVGKDGDVVVLKIHIRKVDDKSEFLTFEEKEIRIRFDGDNTYWLELDPHPRECFRRIQ